jgi:hypothetical protein
MPRAFSQDPLRMEVDIGPLIRATERYAVDVDRGFNEAFRMGVAGMVRRALSVTPPASRASSKANAGEDIEASRVKLTKQDQDRGMTAIQRDLLSIFSGLGTSGGRKKKADSIAEIERIHDRLFERKTPGRRMRSDRPNGDRYVVNEDALNSFRKMLEKRVGYTASGWNAGARALGVKPPAWVGNKSAAGSAVVQVTGSNRRAVITNGDVPPKLDNELRRRVDWGQMAQIKAMERRARFILNHVKNRSRIES